MKTIRIRLVKGLFVIVLFTGATVALSTIGVQTVSQAMAAVSQQQVNTYLVNMGYTVITLAPNPGTKYDWVAHTQKGGFDYTTYIHCDANNIISHEDIQI